MTKSMKLLLGSLLILPQLFMPLLARAELNVFACEPEWAALSDELGGSEVKSYSATTALQDPHYIQARPSLIAKVRRADLVICSGAELEIGWLPALLQKANNRNVMPGKTGYMEASAFVLRQDTSGSVDRSQGDIHPQGNPHIQTNPHNVTAVANELVKRLAELDPDNASLYHSRHTDFSERWTEAIARWEEKALPLQGQRLITHHNSWVYLVDWLGLVEVGNLEAIPGLPPTATHLSQLTTALADSSADVIVRSPYQDGKPSDWLSERTGIPAVVLPLTIGGTEGSTDLFTLYSNIIDILLGAGE
jgi:zinc/manganese transport system substrate-binding protein